MICPLMLYYMFMMDLMFVLNQAILVPIVFIFKIFTFYKLDLSCINKTIDSSYELLFEMEKVEVAGFRRMRTIS